MKNLVRVNLAANKMFSQSYAAYEIVSSLFKGYEFINPLLEKKMAINFRLESKEKGYLLEEKVIKMCEKMNLEKKVKNATCVITSHVRENEIILRFASEAANVIVSTNARGEVKISVHF